MKGLGAAGLALACLTFCAAPLQAAEAPPRITLRVPDLPFPSSNDPQSATEQRVIDEFQHRHPEVDLKAAQGLKIETVTPEATTIMMIAGGIAPDVLPMNFRSLDSFVRQGMAAPLDSLPFAQASLPALLARVPPPVRPVIQRTGPDGRPHVYGLPGRMEVMGLYFNRELFRRAGLPQRGPKDWNELVEFCQAIQKLGPSCHGLLLQGGALASWNFMNFLWSAGGDAVREIAPNDWRAVFDTPEAVTAFAFYYRLVEADRLAIRITGKLTSRERENVGMFFRYAGDTLESDPEVWGFAAVPRGPGGQRGSELNAPVYGIFSGIRDPRVRQAAWDYIAFVNGPEAERIRVETFIQLGQAGEVAPAQLRKFGFEKYLPLSPEGFEGEFGEALANGHPEPYGHNCNIIYNQLGYPLDEILLDPSIRRAWDAGNQDEVRRLIAAILHRAVAETNAQMIGYVPPAKLRWHRQVAAAVAVAIAIAFIVVGWSVGRAFSRQRASRPVAGRGSLPWLCLLPALGLIFVWHYLPLARGSVMAFQDYQILLKSTFVGLDNFANVLFDRSFWMSLLATLHFAAWTLTLGFAAPILLAYALHLIPRGKILYRTLYYLPAVISGTAVFFLWRELFGLDGVLNQGLRCLGFAARRAWTEDPNLAMLSCVIPGIWAGAGPGCLIYLAALKTIPEEQFEASEIDGAGLWQKTSQIVFPALKPLIVINFVGAVAAAFHGATNILIMTGGGPNGLTQVISLTIFYEAFTRMQFGPATAMAWILGSMLIGFSVLQLRRLSAMEFKTAR